MIRQSIQVLIVALLCLLPAYAAQAQSLLAKIPRDGNHQDEQRPGYVQFKDGHWEPWSDTYFKEESAWLEFYYSPCEATYSQIALRERVQLAMSWLMQADVPNWGQHPSRTAKDYWLEEQRDLFGKRFFEQLSSVDQSVIAEGALGHLLSMVSGHLEPDIATDRAVELTEKFMSIVRRNSFNDSEFAICNAVKNLLENRPQDGLSPYAKATREFFQEAAARAEYSPGLAKVMDTQCESYGTGGFEKHTVAKILSDSLKLKIQAPSAYALAEERESRMTRKNFLNRDETASDRALRCPSNVIQVELQTAINKFREYPTKAFKYHSKTVEDIPGEPKRQCGLEFVMSRVAAPGPVGYRLQRKGAFDSSIGAEIHFSTAKEGAAKFYDR